MTVQMRLFVLSLTHAGGPALAFVQRQIQMLLSDCQTDLALRPQDAIHGTQRSPGAIEDSNCYFCSTCL